MTCEFDRIIDRSGTFAFKWEFRRPCQERDIIPLWVADMDFRAPEVVRRAVQDRAEHGVFGYTLLPESYYQSVIEWMQKRHNWEIRKKWMVFTPGVVPALNFAVQAFTEPGDRVLIQPPVYYPFELAVRNNRREPVFNPLIQVNGRHVMDLEHLRASLDERTKMLILCSPHNPVARVWTPTELTELARICLEHDLLIVSDEIHADLVSPTHTHTPLAALVPEMADRIITCTSPNKTFNIAGLQTANTVIRSKPLRRRFQQAVNSAGIELANVFGVVALEAAYSTSGEEWLKNLVDYLWKSYALLREYAAEKMPGLHIHDLEGTYLVWLDGRAYHPDDKKLKDVFMQHGVWLDEGSKFGPGGEGFLRLNIACPRSLLEKALDRMAKALAHMPMHTDTRT